MDPAYTAKTYYTRSKRA